MKYPIAVFAAAVAALASMLPLTAHAVGRLAEVSIYDRAEGRALPVHVHEGRHYVVGDPGKDYEIRIRNRQRGDLLAVVGVDGVDVLSGATADWDQGGYVVGAGQSYAVRGWRKSMDRVAAFYFTALPDAYAARTGRPDHVGVIGVAVYQRKVSPAALTAPSAPFRDGAAASARMAESGAADAPAHERRANDSTPSAASNPVPAAPRLGTGHGRSEASSVVYSEFERASARPAEIITIYYESYRNLLAQGVIRATVAVRPDPFPGRFVPDPR